jgi:sulfide:quinone oxidoreductase
MANGGGRRPRVLIAGGGIAGLETALALADLASDRAELVLLAPEPDFVFKPMTVEEPFTREPAERRELAPALAELGVELLPGSLDEVRADAHRVTTADGAEVAYDFLVVCVGGRAVPAYEGVETFWSNRGDLPVNELIRRAHAAGGELALVVPPATSWPLPLYELALLIRNRADSLDLPDLELRLVTPEPAPLAVFGTIASDAVGAVLAARRIALETSCLVVQDRDGALRLARGHAPIEAEVIIALPEIKGPRVAGLPSDANGFTPIDEHARVQGLDDVYAAGDGTNFPVKQGGLATQQADAAAEHLADRLGADVDVQPFKPVLRGQLITGVESLHMRHGLTGGQGEGVVSPDYLWWPPQKVAGRYLAAWLGHTEVAEPAPPLAPLDVTVSWPHDWHETPMGWDAD